MKTLFSIFVRLFYDVISISSFIDAGEVISERDKCSQCKGNKVTHEKKVLEVHVEEGMQQGQKIVFEGQADEAVSGYMLFVLTLRKYFSELLMLVSYVK